MTREMGNVNRKTEDGRRKTADDGLCPRVGASRAIAPARLPSSVCRFHRDTGFTLIEILAAFVVFALAFGAVMQALSGSIRNTAQSRGYTQAALMARSKLETLGITEPLEAGSSSGELEEGYRYELEISEYEPPPGEVSVSGGDGNEREAPADRGPGANAGNVQPNVKLYRVMLTVYWGNQRRERHAEFSTLRAVRPEL